jgi:cytoskeleton protein RodZ
VLAAYEQTQNKPPPPPLVTQHVSGMHPRARQWLLRAVSGGVLFLLVYLAVNWWLHRPEEPVAVLSAAAPSIVAPPAVSVPLPSVAELATAPASSTQKHAPAVAAVPPPAKAALPRVERRPPPVTPPATMPPVQAASADSGAQNQTHVRFTLSAASWIEVYDAAGKRLYYDLAPAGESVDVSGSGPLQVFLGNAPGVNIELDGAVFNLTPFVRVDNTARFKLGAPGN